MLNPSAAEYWVCDSDSTAVCNFNLYGLQSDDIVLMDRLLVYRLEPQNATLVGITYDDLSTNLSRMIYIYLETMVNDDYSRYDHTALYSGRVDLLEISFEAYLVKNIFKKISHNGT